MIKICNEKKTSHSALEKEKVQSLTSGHPDEDLVPVRRVSVVCCPGDDLHTVDDQLDDAHGNDTPLRHQFHLTHCHRESIQDVSAGAMYNASN